MKAEYVYEAVVRMLKLYTTMVGQESTYDQIIDRPYEWKNSTIFPFYALAATSIIECREEMNRSDIGNKRFSALKRFCKECQQQMHISMSEGFFRNDDYFCLCDSHKFVRILEDVPGLPHLDETKTKALDLSKMLPNESKLLEISRIDYSAIKEATIRAKALMKTERKQPGLYCYQLSNACCINVFSLQTFMEILPDANWYLVTGAKHEPLYMRTPDCEDGFILPVAYGAEIINKGTECEKENGERGTTNAN